MDENNNQEIKEPTKKEKAQQAGKDVAEVGLKTLGNSVGIPSGVTNMMLNTKLGQKVLDVSSKQMARDPFAKNALAKAQPTIQNAKPMLNAASGSLGGNTSDSANAGNTTGQASNATESAGSDSNPSSSASNPLKNIGFGKSGSLPFSNKKREEQKGGTLKNAGEKIAKIKKIMAIISAISPVVFPIIIGIIVIVIVMAQIMTIRDNIVRLANQFTTGVEKFVNFTSGQGLNTNEEVFFKKLNEEYEKFPYTGGSQLDIPLIAATVHYSTTIDLEQYEDPEFGEAEFDGENVVSMAGALDKVKASAFYNYATEHLLGSANTMAWGKRRLLGHVVKTDVSFEKCTWDEAVEGWKELLTYIYEVGIATIDDSSLKASIELVNPFKQLAKFRDIYSQLITYLDQNKSILAGVEYDAINKYYEVQELVYKLGNLFENTSEENYDEEPSNKKGTAWIVAPKIERTMNYGYEEYKQMTYDLNEMKAIANKSDIEYETNEDLINIAKESTNSQLKTLYNSYEKNNKVYMYSYTHYLQNVFIPFNYFYKQEYSKADIDNAVAEIYDQRDFYYYLIEKDKGNYCASNTQAGDLKSLSNEEFIRFLGPIAQMDYNKTGVLASVTLAQAILETGWGKSVPPNSNNIFGIKCGNWPKSKCVKTGTWEEYVPGQPENISAYFRVYDSVEASIEDHSRLLTGSSRYKGLTDTTDYKEQIQIIKNGGYATDSQYVSKLTSLVETYDLTRWDIVVDASNSSFMCGPYTTGGWTIRTTTPTSADKPYTYVSSNRGQCVWYVRARAIEILEELSAKGIISEEQMQSSRDALLNKIWGNAEAWYRNGAKYFNSSSNIKDLRPGSIIVWDGGSTMCSPRCGHVAIIEEVTANTVTITDGWANGGSSCPNSWSCVRFSTRTLTLDQYYKNVPKNWGNHNNTMNFSGYVYFLDPL